ncbi:uncharacterized protein [Diabrotica undecimpunctata]|uniref:uncharacterized protein n=1 Tax=Diabrotica undecimpunctata TaxID=50387 RepID=UPI003B637911
MTAKVKGHSFESGAIDPVSFMYVDPYDVNPLSRSSDLPPATILADIPLKVESSVSQQSQCATRGGVFYVPPKRIKLEMEEFGDLSSFVSPKRVMSNSVDELNTPVFDKDAFDFDISSYQTNVQADLHLMLKCDAAFFRENSSFTPLNKQEDVFINPENMHLNAVAINNQQLYTDADIYSPTASENGTYIVKQSPDNSSMFDMDINSSVSVKSSSRHSSYPSSPVGSVHPAVTETLDDSERSFHSTSSSKPRLSLDLGLGHQTNLLDVNTPSIIAEVVSLESTGFNILDLVKEDDIQFVNDVFPDASTSTLPRSSNVSQKVAVKQPRRRQRMADDDDEDYVPPSMKTSRYPVAHDYSSDSEDEKPQRKKARGRPPKRTESISSDCSKDSDVSKYRELRDKNNEASRKSRMKRKIKELEMDKEADELHNKNIKLKAQVEELEKMVNNFRDNLFKIMINK